MEARPIAPLFTVGGVFSLAFQTLYGCRWYALLLLPAASASTALRMLAAPEIDRVLSAGWSSIVDDWLALLPQMPAILAFTHVALRHTLQESIAPRVLCTAPWRRLLVLTAAGMAFQVATYWPSSALTWTALPAQNVGNYLILWANVLAVDVTCFVFLPALLEERASVLAAVRRSFELIRRHPWRILAIDCASWAFLIALNEGATIAYYAFGWGIEVWASWVTIWYVVAMSLNTALVVAVYRLLRLEREGPARAFLAKVFE